MTPVIDDQLDALAHIHRRRLLVSLLEHNPQPARPAAANDPDTNGEARELDIAMHHAHLPKLEAYGFVSWNRETHQVTKGPRFDEIEPLLTVLIENRDRLPAFVRN